ncbi:MAG: hypothetical protein M3Q94_11580, partial [Pseudomonadota bacterium]|nr:hypothetical protein [Pseudomonadota bacterium]
MANSNDQTVPAIIPGQPEIPISRLDTRGHLLACNDAYLVLTPEQSADAVHQMSATILELSRNLQHAAQATRTRESTDPI